MSVYVFGNSDATKIQEDINKSITTLIEKEYDRTVTKIDFSITLFSSALGIFTIIFGLFYFSRIREAEKAIEEIQKTPDVFFRKFYKEQFKNNIPNLFSENNIKRYNAIQNLPFNSEITINDYEVIEAVLIKEFEYKRNAFFWGNISTIINTMVKIDNTRTIKLLRSLLNDKKYDFSKKGTFISYVVVDESEETKSFIKEKLLSDQQFSQQLIGTMLTTGIINEYLDFIIEECSGIALQTVIGNMMSDYWKMNTDCIGEKLIQRSKDIDVNILNQITMVKLITNKEKATIIISSYIKNENEKEQALNYYLNSIQNDEKNKIEFCEVAEALDVDNKLKAYFTKNKYVYKHFEEISANNRFNLTCPLS